MTTGRRDRKKAALREHISRTATDLFRQHGFEAVSVSEVARAADVARPTVFAHFPRKEDLVFDRTPAVAEALVEAVRSSVDSPVAAVCELLIGSSAPGAFDSTVADQRSFWALVAESRQLQARARELADELERAVAAAFQERDLHEPALCAALIGAAYRSVHLDAIRRTLAGEPADELGSSRAARLAEAFTAVEGAIDRLQH